MKLYLSKPRGFCAGVERAIKTVEEAIRLWGAPIYVKHQIVHNKHVTQRLEKMGVVFVEDLNEVPIGERIIYSAHGVSPAVRALAKKRHLIEIDASCGLVIRVHSAVKRFVSKGYKIILIGHKNHVEVIGTVGQAPKSTTVIESVEDVKTLSFPPTEKLFYITQTTLSIDDVKDIAEELKKKFPNIETLPTSSICYATTNRQQALDHMIQDIDLVLVVGDPTSSNSNRLCELAINRGVSAHLINDPDDIDSVWFNGVKHIALTAGASTPEVVVQNCIATLKTFGVQNVEEVVFTEEDVFFQLPRQVLFPPS